MWSLMSALRGHQAGKIGLKAWGGMWLASDLGQGRRRQVIT